MICSIAVRSANDGGQGINRHLRLALGDLVR